MNKGYMGAVCEEANGVYTVRLHKLKIHHFAVATLMGRKIISEKETTLGLVANLTKLQASQLRDFLIRFADPYVDDTIFGTAFAALTARLPSKLFFPKKRQEQQRQAHEIMQYLDLLEEEYPGKYLVGFPDTAPTDLSEDDVVRWSDAVQGALQVGSR